MRDTMGYGTSFYSYDDAVRRFVGTAWSDGQGYSKKIWGATDRLAAYIQGDLAKAIARGASYDSLVRELGHRFEKVSLNSLTRIVQTEGTYVARQAQAAELIREGFEEYALDALEDGRTCAVCRGLDGKSFRFEDMAVGQDFPPLHPRCRCVVSPHVGSWDAWLEKQAEKEWARLAAKRFGAGGRKAMDTEAFGGSFGEPLDEARSAYTVVRKRRDVERVIRERTGMTVDADLEIASMPDAMRGSVLAAVEHGASFVGGKARNLKLVASRELEEGVIAEMRRRGDDGTMYLDLARLDGGDLDEVEQIVFHEMAHAAEWRFTTPGQHEEEVDEFLRWLSGSVDLLPQNMGSKQLLEAVTEAGFEAWYDEENGKVELDDDGKIVVWSISSYAADGADAGTQDSELIAETLRYVAVNGTGVNAIADAIYRRFADGQGQ